MSDTINLKDELEDIVDQLRAQHVAADVDRDKVALPGVWVTIAGVSLDGLGFYTVHALLIVLAGENTPTVWLGKADEVANKVLALWNPEGDLTPVTVTRAGTALPGLSIPVDFRCEYQGDQ